MTLVSCASASWASMAHDAHPFLRLVKVSSDVLPQAQAVAIVDGRHGGVSIGRDKTFTPRLRLPSMEVSKHHANIYSTSRAPIRYSVSDTGSTHGTFVCRRDQPTSPSDLAALPGSSFQRLSQPKHASQPWDLRHYDLLRIGLQCTVFEVHLHGTAWDVCDRCAISPDGLNEISLAPLAGKQMTSSSRPTAADRPSSGPHPVQTDARKRLHQLKKAYFPPTHSTELAPRTAPTYRDRAALRRTKQPGQRPPRPTPAAAPSPAASAPAVPLGSDHVGYQLLAKMAQDSGEAMPSRAPIVPRVAAGRAGLGSTGMLDAETYAQGTPQARYQAQGRETARRRYEAEAPP
ncbi:Hypothetical protein MSYG_1140 [Malassezia sympodialis ATCC 42132]|uniref:FHA domain-containing protein n=1 Tax=Malassezia sympodialis (strain ATCC 42132) TaxID=1230383 RepID=A0A1M8A321_MALS4|nr:Hypothetical protein MSYG_1140 [Malassezia sympodialis ATCC 42132]